MPENRSIGAFVLNSEFPGEWMDGRMDGTVDKDLSGLFLKLCLEGVGWLDEYVCQEAFFLWQKKKYWHMFEGEETAWLSVPEACLPSALLPNAKVEGSWSLKYYISLLLSDLSQCAVLAVD